MRIESIPKGKCECGSVASAFIAHPLDEGGLEWAKKLVCDRFPDCRRSTRLKVKVLEARKGRICGDD